MTRSNGSDDLARLRGEIPGLRPFSESRHDLFQQWYSRVLGTLETIFGPSSDEVNDFCRIRFQIAPDVVRQLNDLASEAVSKQLGVRIPAGLIYTADAHFQQALSQADELLRALTLSLRRRGHHR